MSLWAKSNNEQYKMDNARVSFSADPLNVLIRLEDKAIEDLHPEDMPDERSTRRLSISERQYVRYFINRKI